MNISVIGSGFSSLSAAAYLAKSGHQVTLYEKNAQVGGRARMFEVDGFKFDMGPSWYWMPEVFDKFFADHGKKTSELYDLVRLDPSYQIFFEDETIEVPADFDDLVELFDRLEPAGGDKLKKFIKAAETKYKAAMEGPVMLPGLSLFELLQPKIIKSATQLTLTQSYSTYVRRQFDNPKIHQILEFPILFLGPSPRNIPALYSMLNYADIKLGTWYPMGGMRKIVDGMVAVLKDYGVEIVTNASVDSLGLTANKVETISVNGTPRPTDLVVGGADYHHIETVLLPKERQQYSSSYWEKRDMAPSAMLMYLGVKGEIKGLLHHNLFFDANFEKHLSEINDNPSWPEDPLFYICNPSKTDPDVAPEGYENLFVLIPSAAGLIKTDEALQNKYLELVIQRLKKRTGEDISDRIVYKKFFTPQMFIEDYNAFKGNAYGLANTLMQTHYLKPRMRHKSIKNLYYTGQLTVPGPGVPPSILSGEIAASLINNR